MSLTIANKPINPIGFGCMSLTNYFKPIEQDQAFSCLKAALKNGANFWNAGWIYGTPDYNSLHLLNAYFTKYPEDADKVVISIKACFDMKSASALVKTDQVKAEVEQCLKIADGKFKIDVFQAARLDPDVPVEETVLAIASFVQSGRIGGVGMSECSASSIRKAAAVTKIAAVEVEVSLFETSIFSNGVADACKEHDIPIVAYSPLGRSFLTGEIKKYEDLPKDDFRHHFPRFSKENFDQNIKLVEEVEAIAKRKGCTSGQVAIAWVIAQCQAAGVTAVPIPGTQRVGRVEENVKRVELSAEELKEIDKILEQCEVKGDRYPAQFQKFLNV